MRRLKKTITTLTAITLAFAMLVLPSGMEVEASMKQDTIAMEQMMGDNVTMSLANEGISPRGVIMPNATIVGDGVRLRSEPSSTSTVREVLYYGEDVILNVAASTMYSDGTWLYVQRVKTGTWGWVSAQYVLRW